jgi:hypothetical protein
MKTFEDRALVGEKKIWMSPRILDTVFVTSGAYNQLSVSRLFQ